MMPDTKGSVFSARFVKNHKAAEANAVRSPPRTTAGFVTRGRFVMRGSGRNQRVSVTTCYKKTKFADSSNYHRSLRTNAAYITRDGLLDAVDETGAALTLDEAIDKTHEWDDDARYYRFIISPEHGAKLDLDRLAADTMESARHDLLTDDEIARGVTIQYLYSQHWDTDHPHLHVMMRASIDGRDLKLTEGYFTEGLKARAEQAATKQIGFRIEREMSPELERLEAEKYQKLLMDRREERGLDRHTGKALAESAGSTEETAEKTTEKSLNKSRDDHGYDGGFD